MGRHATRQRTRRAARPLLVALAVGAVTVGTGTLVLLDTPRTATPTASADRAAPPPTVTLAVGGAVSFGGRTLPLLEDPAGPFAGTVDVLRDADVTLVALVAPADGSATPPAAAPALAAAGVDDVGLLDTRWTGPASADTASALTAAGVGHGSTWRAGTTPVPVSVLTVPADPTDDRGVLAEVSRADRAGDVVVVRLAGTPGADCPGPPARDLAAALVAAGADVVVGGAAAGGPAGADGRRAWVLPTPGPLLDASDAGPVDSELVVVQVSADGVQGARSVPLSIDAFGRAQPSAAASSEAARCEPATGR